MSERDGYEPGVPCWVAAVEPDAERAAGFYAELMGWETTNLMAPDAEGKYFLCRLRGRAVAGPFDVPGFRTAVLADPQGAVFSVSQLIVPSA